MNIFNREKNISQAFFLACKLIDKKKGPILGVKRDRFYNDQPKFFHYTSVIKISSQRKNDNNDNLAGGSALDKERAILKALSEGIERYSLTKYVRKSFIKDSYRSLFQKLSQKKSKTLILNPADVVTFSSQQLSKPEFKQFFFDKDSHFNWTKGFSLFKNKPILVPSQLVYVPYYCDSDESILRHPITTGAASGTSYAGAIYRGICEVIERDAFMINYLNMLPGAKIVNLPKRIQDIIDIFTRYHFKVYIIELTTDIPVPVFAAIILDYSGIGPAVSIGLKADLDTESAILGAIEEAEHSIPFMRGLLSKQKPIIHPEKIDSFEKRAIFWSDVSMIQKLDFWLENGQSKIFENSKFFQTSTLFKFKRILKFLNDKVSDIIFIDVTTDNIRKNGFLALKVIIPELHPLYLYEDFSYHGGERLYQVPVRLGFRKTAINESELNAIPHPFL